MGQVVVVTSGKGGVGKTTTTANLGTGLALEGHRVCLVDADIGLRNLDLLLGLEDRIVYDLVDVCNGHCKYKKALIKSKHTDNLYLLPAAQTKDKTAVRPDQMRDLCNELKLEFDYVLIDCPAGIEQGFQNAIAGADRSIIVTTPEVSAIRDADRVIGLLEANEKYNPMLIINRYRPGMVKRGDMLDVESVLEILNIELLGIVPEDEQIVVTTNRGKPAVLGNSKAGDAYRHITRRLLDPSVPLLEPDADEGFLSRLGRFFRFGTR